MSARRLAFVVGAWLALMGPTPGAVGACGGDDLAGPADFQPYCQQREQLICVRRDLRREITDAERDRCRLAGIDACKLRSFPSDCHPTERQARTCLNALASFDTLNTKEDKLPECVTSALCQLPPSAASDAAASDAGGTDAAGSTP